LNPLGKPYKDYSRDDWVKFGKLCYGSVFEFAKIFFPHLLKEKTPQFHLEIYKLLPIYNYLAIEAFRGGAKSTIGLIIYPIWHALFKHLGDISLISRSENFILNEVTRKIRYEFESNELLRMFFGDMTTSKWSESYFTLKNGISFEGKGIEGQLRGGRRALIALDDLEDNESVLSEEQRDKLKQRIGKELIPKLIKGGQICYFGTPIHPLCYLHQIVQTPNNGWEKRVYDSYKEGIEQVGNESWPEVFPHDRLQQFKKLMGSAYFAAEYRCKPVADEKQPIKEEMIRYWTELPKQYSAVISVDPAYSEDETADYKVASLIAIDHNSNRYLIHYIRTHESLNNFMNSILTLWGSNKNVVTAVGIPNSGTEKSFFDSFIKFAESKNQFPPVVELKNTFTNAQTQISVRNKHARIRASLVPLFEQGKYYIRPEHLEAREELLTLGVSRWDDLTDTMSYAEQIIQPVFIEQNSFEDENRPLVIANYGF